MSELIEYTLEDGSKLYVETVETADGTPLVEASRAGKAIKRASQSFSEALDTLKPAASAIIGKVRELSDPPDSIAVEFGLTLTAEAGAYVAMLGTTANYKVTLTWTKETAKK